MYEIAVRERTVLDEAMSLATLDNSYSKEHLNALLSVHKAMLPIESKAIDDLNERILNARQDVHQEQVGLPKLSFEPLAWRHQSGLPKIVPMDLRIPTFSIGASRGDSRTTCSYVNPNLPALLRECFRDVAEMAERYCYRRRSSMEYTFEFTGMIPDSTRLKISEATTRFDWIYLLVETPDTAWKVKRTKGITRRQEIREALANISIDPIVVGYKHDALWVIDKFDLTSVEQYVLDEFSQLALPSGE